MRYLIVCFILFSLVLLAGDTSLAQPGPRGGAKSPVEAEIAKLREQIEAIERALRAGQGQKGQNQQQGNNQDEGKGKGKGKGFGKDFGEKKFGKDFGSDKKGPGGKDNAPRSARLPNDVRELFEKALKDGMTLETAQRLREYLDRFQGGAGKAKEPAKTIPNEPGRGFGGFGKGGMGGFGPFGKGGFGGFGTPDVKKAPEPGPTPRPANQPTVEQRLERMERMIEEMRRGGQNKR